MKKISFLYTSCKKFNFYLILFMVAASAFIYTGCSKTQDTPKDQMGSILTADILAKDELFIKLNNAINRFDPKYLQLVFNDKRTTEELIARSSDLTIQLKSNPDDASFQKQMADFYHFKSVEEFKSYSASITDNLKLLDSKYNFQNTLYKEGGGLVFYDARRVVAKNKIEANNGGERKMKTLGLWTDMVETYLSEFDYLSYVYDEELEAAKDGGGGSGICAGQLDVCKSESRSKFIFNIGIYGGTGAVAGARAGFSVGTIYPFIGNIYGAVGGGLIVGGLGVIFAYNLYYADLDVCKAKYNLCINTQ